MNSQYTLYGTAITNQIVKGTHYFPYTIPGSCMICCEEDCICENRPMWSAKHNE